MGKFYLAKNGHRQHMLLELEKHSIYSEFSYGCLQDSTWNTKNEMNVKMAGWKDTLIMWALQVHFSCFWDVMPCSLIEVYIGFS